MGSLQQTVQIGGKEIAVSENDQDPEVDHKNDHQDSFLSLLSCGLEPPFLFAGEPCCSLSPSPALQLPVCLPLYIIYDDRAGIGGHDRDQYINTGFQASACDVIPGTGNQKDQPLEPAGHYIVDSERHCQKQYKLP